MNVYHISGLGADKRVFSKIKYPSHCNPIYIDWIEPIKNESLVNYAKRLSLSINRTEPFILIGVSFGGMIAVEIAKELNPVLTILIATIPCSNLLPLHYRFMGVLRFNNFIPPSLIKSSNLFSYYLFGVKTKEEKHLLNSIIFNTDLFFLKWALSAILKWDNEKIVRNTIHIHGTSDKILPIKYVTPSHKIKGGGHLIVYTHSNIVSEIIFSKLSLL